MRFNACTSKGLATARQPARLIWVRNPRFQTFSISDIYVPRVHPLGEWFHVSLVLWEFERQATTLNYLYTPDSMLQLLRLETAMATTTTTTAVMMQQSPAHQQGPAFLIHQDLAAILGTASSYSRCHLLLPRYY